jgi:hypothetical protein
MSIVISILARIPRAGIGDSSGAFFKKWADSKDPKIT